MPLRGTRRPSCSTTNSSAAGRARGARARSVAAARTPPGRRRTAPSRARSGRRRRGATRSAWSCGHSAMTRVGVAHERALDRDALGGKAVGCALVLAPHQAERMEGHDQAAARARACSCRPTRPDMKKFACTHVVAAAVRAQALRRVGELRHVAAAAVPWRTNCGRPGGDVQHAHAAAARRTTARQRRGRRGASTRRPGGRARPARARRGRRRCSARRRRRRPAQASGEACSLISAMRMRLGHGGNPCVTDIGRTGSWPREATGVPLPLTRCRSRTLENRLSRRKRERSREAKVKLAASGLVSCPANTCNQYRSARRAGPRLSA